MGQQDIALVLKQRRDHTVKEILETEGIRTIFSVPHACALQGTCAL